MAEIYEDLEGKFKFEERIKKLGSVEYSETVQLRLIDGQWQEEQQGGSLGFFAFSRNLVKGLIREEKHDEAWSVAHQAMATPFENWWLNFDFHEYLADILRKEEKHTQALVHILAWYAVGFWGSQNLRNFDGELCKPLANRYDSKLKAYFNRCKFKSVSLDECGAYAESLSVPPNLTEIQDTVSGWNENHAKSN